MSINFDQQESFRNPEYYEHKANQLRLENEFLRRQLENGALRGPLQEGIKSEKNYTMPKSNNEYTFHHEVPVRQVIYNPVSEPIRPPIYVQPQQQSSFEAFQERPKTQSYYAYEQEQPIPRYQTVYYNQPYFRPSIDETELEIIELQARGSKLEREAYRLSSYIKEDLRGFIKDSHINKECSYKQKYLRAISTRPRYFRLNA